MQRGRGGFSGSLHFEASSDIPIGKGLGSSAAALLAGAALANATLGLGLGADELAQVCARLEGHGDNVGAAAFGGILNAGLSRYLTGEGDLLSRILTPEQRATLPTETLAPLMQEFARSLHIIFVILAVMAVATLAIGTMLPKGRGLRR